MDTESSRTVPLPRRDHLAMAESYPPDQDAVLATVPGSSPSRAEAADLIVGELSRGQDPRAWVQRMFDDFPGCVVVAGLDTRHRVALGVRILPAPVVLVELAPSIQEPEQLGTVVRRTHTWWLSGSCPDRFIGLVHQTLGIPCQRTAASTLEQAAEPTRSHRVRQEVPE